MSETPGGMMFVGKLFRLLEAPCQAVGTRSKKLQTRRKKPGELHRRSLRTEQLEARTLMAADVLITEFMADNENGLTEGDGDREDWIELYNAGDQAQNLLNWSLTDNASNLGKWKFPNITINPGQTLIIFADDDKTPPPGELHAGFALSKGGEYLALVNSDGAIVQQFAPRFPGQFTDISYGLRTTSAGGVITVHDDEPPRYFMTPSPGQPNVASSADTRPIIIDVANTAASDSVDARVTARVVAAGSPVTQVNMTYRVMYGAETTVPMFDDGAHGDGAALDGIFGASIPASISGPGQMVRYYVTARTAANTVGRHPLFLIAESAQYRGFVIPDPSISTTLDVFEMFVPNPNWFRNANGTMNRSITTGSFYHEGNFYDNIRISIRGDSSVANAYLNQKFKIDFNDDHKFDPGDDRGPTGSINLDNVYRDPSFVRITIGAEIFREAGAYGQIMEHVHARMNGQFYSLGLYAERPNAPFLRRNGLDDEGALYESEGLRDSQGYLVPWAGGLANTFGMQKDNREWDPSFADLQNLVNGISPSNPFRDRYIYDNVDIPNVVNVLAVYSIIKHYDKDTHNFYVYRDSDDTGLWTMIPWDLDLIFNRLREPLYDRDYFTGHPFEGSSQDPTWAGTHWNVLIDAFADSPTLSQMLLRRVRTLMDEILQPLSTPYEQRILETRIDALNAQVLPDGLRDMQRWGSHMTVDAWGGPWNHINGLQHLKDGINQRRAYLYSLNVIPNPQSAAANVSIGAIDVEPASGDQDEEFIQLVNNSGVAVDISGWKLSATGGGDKPFQDYIIDKGVVIPAFGSVYIAANVNAFRGRPTGPRHGQGLFIQGGFKGHLAPTGGTITLTRSNNTVASTLNYGPVAVRPEFGAMASISFTSGTTTLPIALPVSDGDTPTASLTLSAGADTLFKLDTQYRLAPYSSGNYFFNARGNNEKYLFDAAGNTWYYIMPDGEFYRLTGNRDSSAPGSLHGLHLANVGVDVYGNPALLHNAVSTGDPLIFNFAAAANPTLTITAPAGVSGQFLVTLTASDGVRTNFTNFWVTVQQPAPMDVDGDNLVSPLDALLIINRLNALGPSAITPGPNGTLPQHRYDTSGDNFISALDALLVINLLNAQGAGQGEPDPRSFAPEEHAASAEHEDLTSGLEDTLAASAWYFGFYDPLDEDDNPFEQEEGL